MCGASSEQKNAYQQAESVQSTLKQNYNTIFKGNQNILSGIESSLSGIVGAGIGQYGFTPEEDAARKTNILETTAAATRQAAGKVGEQLAAGSNVDLPSGSKAAIQADIATKGAQSTATALQQETAQGYEQGRENFLTAEQRLASAPGELENPVTAAAHDVTSSTQELGTAANTITAANRAWEKPLAGLVGGVVGAIPGLGTVGAAIGKGLAGASSDMSNG